MTGEQLEFRCEPSALGGCGPIPAASERTLNFVDFGQHTPKGHASEWGLLLPAKMRALNFCLTYYCELGANDLFGLGSNLASMTINKVQCFCLLLFFFFCSDFSRAPGKVVPMTIALCNAAWTEHET